MCCFYQTSNTINLATATKYTAFGVMEYCVFVKDLVDCSATTSGVIPAPVSVTVTRTYWPGVTPQSHPNLDHMVGYAIHYFRDFVLPAKTFRIAGETERAALTDLRDALSQLPPDTPAEKIQEVVYEVGRRPPFLDTTGKIKTKDGKPGVSLEWFNMLYQVLLGQEKGPRFGSFAAVYGLANTVEMIDGALARSA